MQQSSLRTPLCVLTLGLLVVGFLLIRPTEQQVAHSQGYNAPATATSIPQATATAQPTAATTATRAVTQATATTVIATQTQPVPTAVIPTARPLPTTPPIQPTVASVKPTAELSNLSDAVTCSAGIPVEIRGKAPPRAALLIYFGQRAVGGGSARADGSFTLTLNVGEERSGSYPVQVLVRGSWEQVATLTCVVPYLSPTPRIVN